MMTNNGKHRSDWYELISFTTTIWTHNTLVLRLPRQSTCIIFLIIGTLYGLALAWRELIDPIILAHRSTQNLQEV